MTPKQGDRIIIRGLKMKRNKNGCSTCPEGQEQYETFWFGVVNRNLVRYNYRTPEGKLFSCIATSLEIARRRRNKWLQEKEGTS